MTLSARLYALSLATLAFANLEHNAHRALVDGAAGVDSLGALAWFEHKPDFTVCGLTTANKTTFLPVRLEQMLRWPATYPSPYPNTTLGPLLALGLAEPCLTVSGLFDKACNTVVYPHVLRSADGGRTWECSSPDSPAVSALHAAYISYSSAESESFAALTAPGTCNLVCVIGGQNAGPDLPGLYGRGSEDVWCTRDGVSWDTSKPLPFPVVGATAFVSADYIVVVGGVRPLNSSAAHLRAAIDPATCTVGTWTVMEVSDLPGVDHSTAFYYSTLHWCASFPSLRETDDCASGWCNPTIVNSAVTFCSVGYYDLRVVEAGPDGFTLLPMLQASSMPFLLHSTDDGVTWYPTSDTLPTSTMNRNAPPRGNRLRGDLDLPRSTLALTSANLTHRRPLLLMANSVAFLSLDDGRTWQPLQSIMAGDDAPLEASRRRSVATMPAPLVTGLGRSVQHRGALTVHLWDYFSDAVYMGHTRECPVSCQEDFGLPAGFYLSTPCQGTPWSAQCRRCTVCETGVAFVRSRCRIAEDTQCAPCTMCEAVNMTYAVPCSAYRDAVCEMEGGGDDGGNTSPNPSPTPQDPLPLPPNPAIVTPPAGPWVESVLYAVVLIVWALFVFASGAPLLLCGPRPVAGQGEAKKVQEGASGSSTSVASTVSQQVCEFSRGVLSPSYLRKTTQPVSPLSLGLLVALAYHSLDMSLLIAAARLPLLSEGDRQVLAAAGLLGTLSLMGLFAASVMRARTSRVAWLKARSSWVRALKAQPGDTNCTPECGPQLTVVEDRRLQQLQAAAASFALHPLSSLWLEVQVEEAMALAQTTVTHLAHGPCSDANGNTAKGGLHSTFAATAGNWGTLPARRLTREWTVVSSLLSDGCQVLACLMAAGVLQRGAHSTRTSGSVFYGLLSLVPLVPAAATWLAFGRRSVAGGGLVMDSRHPTVPGQRELVQDYAAAAGKASTVDNPLGPSSWRQAGNSGLASSTHAGLGVLPHLHKARLYETVPLAPALDGPRHAVPAELDAPAVSTALSLLPAVQTYPPSAAAAAPNVGAPATIASGREPAAVGSIAFLPTFPRPPPARRMDDGSVTVGTSRTWSSHGQLEVDAYGQPVLPVPAEEGWAQLTGLLRSTRADRVVQEGSPMLHGVEEGQESEELDQQEQERGREEGGPSPCPTAGPAGGSGGV